MSDLVHGDSMKKYAEENKNTRLCGCCDLDAERAEVYRQKYGFEHSYTDYKLMLDSEKPDAVCIVSPVNTTAELSCDVMKRGYPVIMEKPPGMNLVEVEQIVNASKKYDKLAMAAFNRRYMPLLSHAKKIIDKFSNISSIYYTMVRYRRYDEDFSTTTIHAIDAVRYLSGSDYKSVNLSYQQVEGQRENVENIYLDAVMKSGTRVHIDFVVAAGIQMEKFTVNGFDNTLDVYLPFGASPGGWLKHYYNNSPAIEVVGKKDVPDFISQGFYDENRIFFENVKKDKSCNNSDIHNAYSAVEIAEAIRKRKSNVDIIWE